MKIIQMYKLLLIGVLLVTFTACAPPTPPPAPTRLPVTPAETVTPNEQAVPSTIEPTATLTPTPKPQATPVSAISAPTTTNIIVWENLPQPQTEQLQKDILVFQNAFPQYAVTLQHYDSPESFMKPLMAGETDFDVALVSPGLLGNLWTAGKIAPMSDFFLTNFTNDFVGTTLVGASRDDELWGLSDTAGFHLLLFYNRDLIDTPPTNTDELSTLAKALTDGDASTDSTSWGLAVNSYDPLWVAPWLAAYGGWLIDDQGQPTLNTPAMESALTLYLGWQGQLTGIAPVATYEEARNRFINGDAAMLIDGEWTIGELARSDKVNWGVASLPAVGKAGESQPAAPLVLARYWTISRSATNGDQALASAAFLEYITKPERQLDWTVKFGLLPTRISALDDLIIANDTALRISAEQMQAGRSVPLGVNVNTLLNAMRQPLQGVIDGKLTPQEAADIMQTNLEEK